MPFSVQLSIKINVIYFYFIYYVKIVNENIENNVCFEKNQWCIIFFLIHDRMLMNSIKVLKIHIRKTYFFNKKFNIVLLLNEEEVPSTGCIEFLS